MLITFLDDSIPFDGHSPVGQPLGGAEKAVAGLAGALARRGHTVRVFNRCDLPIVVDGVSWQPLDSCQAAHSDWLIAHRKPSLFGRLADADNRILWLAGPLGYLNKPDALASLHELQPTMLLQGHAHSLTVPAPLHNLSAETVVPGIASHYRTATEMTPANPPRAVVTTHPSSGLDWLLELWTSQVFPRVPWAELHVYSASLEWGAQGAEVAESLRPVLDQALAAKDKGVRIFRPLPDPAMAEVYRVARVHLYPGNDRDVLCTTLGESQAVGLPAVSRDKGAAKERILNGETGYLAPDDDAFANLAVRLLDDRDT
ncbi:MAG: glycosyltransferase, partial [Alphaproteobacteria bacterium]|nr:glycosyltransferase [Alphaproteobacteria bacterium]